jgi:hypothetical protein
MNRLWILTGCANSKMEQAIIEHHTKAGFYLKVFYYIKIVFGRYII